MHFTSPLALLLLTLIPVFAILGWPGRGFGRRREIFSLSIRLAIVLCLVLSLAGLEIVRAADDLAVVFLIDASDSMPPAAQDEAVDYVRQAMAEMKPDDQAAVVVFGGDALVERLMSSSSELGPITSIPRSSQTDLSAAIRLALALYPPDAARRMVLLSDGDATRGDALAAARVAAANGVQILSVPFGGAPSPEVWVTSVQVPTRLRQEERFDLQLGVEATQATSAEVRVLAGGQVIYQGTHEFQRGAQSFRLPLTADQAGIGDAGFVRFEAQIAPAQDGFYQNNELSAFTQIEGPPRILLVSPPAGEALPSNQETRPDEAAQLLQALEAANFEVTAARPSELPSELAALAPYASVVMVDVPGRDLSDRQMQAVQSYVRDLGGGLLVVGGPTSYGVGGYFRTPLEETLPVDMQIKDEQRRPALTMVFIIDRSGSMSDTSGGVSKLELAKEAAIRSTEMLYPSDRIGVIAFDENATWVVPPTELSDPDSVIRSIGSLRSGGGTDIMAGLQLMAKTLPGDPASLKHVILLTDGGADPSGIPQLVEQLHRDYGITLTTIGVGQDAAEYLPELARLGGGRYHFTADPATIPRIFSEETSLAARSYIIEKAFTPRRSSASPILAGIEAVPQLYGYVGTTAKSTAQTILVSDENDPILAAWQYGLGKAVAFTSDASGRWGRDWIMWQGFPSFWAQAVSYTFGGRSSSPLDVRVEPSQDGLLGQTGTAQLVVNSQTENGDYLNDYDMQANLVAPDGQTRLLELQQSAPGRYQATFSPDEQGVYLLRVSGNPRPSDGALSQNGSVETTAGFVQSYSPEYRGLNPDPGTLARISALTGGRILGNQPGEVFDHDLPAGRATRPVWPWLLSLAALLLPLDVAVRRLVITPGEVKRAWERMASGLRQRGEVPVPARSRRMTSLMQAKQRATESDIRLYPEEPTPEGTAEGSSNQRAWVEKPSAIESPEKQEGEPKQSEPEEIQGESRSTAANLLAAKRKRQKRN